jgi:hypothetical protein
LAAAGGNYFRLWIGATNFGFAVEEKLGDYSSTQEKGKTMKRNGNMQNVL